MALEPATYRAIHEAIETGDIAALRAVLEPFGPFPTTSPDATIGLPLVYAIYHGPMSLVGDLLDAGADPDGSDGDGFPPLIAAIGTAESGTGATAREDVGDLVQLLLDHGVDIHQRGHNDWTPLHLAARLGRLDLVDLLLAAGADPNSTTRIDDHDTPLDEAATAGHDAVVDRLRPLTTLIDWEDAVEQGSLRDIRRLVRSGHDVDATDRYSQTALMRSAHAGRADVVGWLIEQRADLDRTAKFGLSALMLAVIGGYGRVARALVNAGADTTLTGTGAPGFAGRTAADLADERGDHRLADFIRRASSDPARKA